MPNLLYIWEWKFSNIFVTGNTFKKNVSPGQVISYFRTILKNKDLEKRKELKRIADEVNALAKSNPEPTIETKLAYLDGVKDALTTVENKL